MNVVVGDRVRLVRCTDEYTRLRPGTEGTVRLLNHGTVHVQWDTGEQLGLCPDAGDRFEVVR